VVDNRFDIALVVVDGVVLTQTTHGHACATLVDLDQLESCSQALKPGLQFRVLPSKLYVLKRAG
jgi:hypothetical protein